MPFEPYTRLQASATPAWKNQQKTTSRKPERIEGERIRRGAQASEKFAPVRLLLHQE
jgi:hypothetical protein